MKIALFALLLVLSGCDPVAEVTIRTDEWVCSEVTRQESTIPLIAGKAVVPQVQSRLECAQWTRMGEQP
ncbi:hypothetical protein D9M69_672810 [compost metagenome]